MTLIPAQVLPGHLLDQEPQAPLEESLDSRFPAVDGRPPQSLVLPFWVRLLSLVPFPRPR